MIGRLLAAVDPAALWLIFGLALLGIMYGSALAR